MINDLKSILSKSLSFITSTFLGMSKEEICYLKKNVSITDNLQNEDQKSYPAVGKYKIYIKYNNKLSTIQIFVKIH